jgi:hypothetical protein
MTLGPLEYTVIGFDGNRFDGSIVNEITRVVESGTIAVVDLVFITKDSDGVGEAAELDRKDDPRFAGLGTLIEGTIGLLTQEDIQQLVDDLPPSTSAMVVLFEHRWAVHVKRAVLAAGGFLISRETIVPERIEMLNNELERELESGAVPA